MGRGLLRFGFSNPPARGVHIVMKRMLVSLALGAALSACGFGNWSTDDFLFARAVPKKELVELKVPGMDDAESALTGALEQGLNGRCNTTNERESLTCMTRAVAKLFNGVTFSLIDLVREITAHEPSRRAQGQRVWGPWYDSATNRTFRFEMRRDDGLGTGGFKYCLHGAVGSKTGFRADADVRCGADRAGFVEVLSGTYIPESGTQDARQAMGTMDLNLAKQKAAGLNTRDDPRADGRYQFTYDTTHGQRTIHIELAEVTNQDTGLPTRANYTYHQAQDGSGRMDLLLANPEARLDSLELHARWNSEGAGRVDGVGVREAIFDDVTYVGWECTNASLEIVARKLDWAPERDVPSTGPDPSLCAQDIPAL